MKVKNQNYEEPSEEIEKFGNNLEPEKIEKLTHEFN